jgi:hypothetical protein
LLHQLVLVRPLDNDFGILRMVCIYGASCLLIWMHCALFGDADMNKSLKIATVAAVLLLALGCFSFVYASAQTNSSTANNGLTTNQQISQFIQNHPGVGSGALGRFLNHATLAEITGTVVSEFNGMLVLSTGSGQVRVLLPKMWSYNNQLLNRTELINSDFVGAGQTVTFKVLKGEWAETGFSINIMIAYEAVNSANAHAYAVLPFNIETNS